MGRCIVTRMSGHKVLMAGGERFLTPRSKRNGEYATFVDPKHTGSAGWVLFQTEDVEPITTHDWVICFASGSHVLAAVECEKEGQAKPPSLSLCEAYSYLERISWSRSICRRLFSEEDKGGCEWKGRHSPVNAIAEEVIPGSET
jgi:hypothetical protein